MKQETKIILLISGAVILVGAIGLGIYLHFTNKKSENKEKSNGNDPGSGDNKENPPAGNDDNPTYTPPPNYNTQPVPGMVSPQYNSENELNNPLSELKDQLLYPKRKEVGGWGYANVRSSTNVNTESAWYDPFDNLLTTINSGTPIGKVTGEAAAEFNGYSYRWFKVRLLKPVGFWGSTYDGFVRADTVTIKPYEK